MTNQANRPRMGVVLLVGFSAIVGLGLLLTFLGRGPGEPSLAVEPTAPGEVPVATVNGREISLSRWVEAALLDQVMSRLAGRPLPGPYETLQRLINESLVLEAFPPPDSPTDDEVEARITALERAWGTDDETVRTALEQVGLERASFVQAVRRLLEVQAALDEMATQGYDYTAWLEERRAAAEVEFDDDLVDETVPRILAQGNMVRARPSSEPTGTPTRQPTPTSTVSPTEAVVGPETAPDFSLPKAGGGTFTLTEQLKHGPVVLIFFQKCG